jgi:thiosulfate/3-mercaptopyruvate sulfurtransferase
MLVGVAPTALRGRPMEAVTPLPDARIDDVWIASHLNDPSVRFVEVDVSAAAYKAGHIPGAVLWNAYTDLRHPDYGPVSDSELQDLLRKSGVTPDMTLVFYGYGAHLGFWLLTSYGHRDVRLMDGSRERWTTGGRSWSTDIPAPAASQYELGPQAKFFSSRQDVQKNIGRETPVILDTRSKLEFDGERFWPSGATAGAGRAGHVPGAVHLPVELLRTEDGAFRSDAEMLREFRDRGITTESDVITYCTIGNRASQAWYALTYLLGNRNARVYYGSWAEWGTTAEAPIEP